MGSDSLGSIRKGADQAASHVIDDQLDIRLGGDGIPQRSPSVRWIRPCARKVDSRTSDHGFFDRGRGRGQKSEIIAENEKGLPDLAVHLTKFELSESSGPRIDDPEKLIPRRDPAPTRGKFSVQQDIDSAAI